MVYQRPRVSELNCSLNDAFEIAREDFGCGNSCCQVIIDANFFRDSNDIKLIKINYKGK